MHDALSIPELLDTVFEELHTGADYRRTLLSCALVSKSWSDPAISKLWSGHQAIVLQNSSKCDNEIVDRLAEISRNV
jgi:hypothetical protein